MASRILDRISQTLLLASLAIAGLPTNTLADDKVWQFNEGNDPTNKGRATARLVYGVPETDDTQVSAICDAGPSSNVSFSSITFGADTGELKDGEEVKLRFSGGGFSHELSGQVYGTNSEEGISGVIVDVKHDNKLWQGLTGKRSLDYLVPGYRATTLNLEKGRGSIRSFVNTCRDYADAVLSGDNDDKKNAQSADSSANGISEKEAFESAKELGTVEAWEAFLNNYPSGFRADLARAYVKRLGTQDNKDINSPGSPPPPPTPDGPPTLSPPPGPRLSMVDLGPGRSRWVNGYERLKIANGRSTFTASVRAKGVELVTYCMDNQMSGGFGKRLGAIVRERSSGTYPQYMNRVRQGQRTAIPLQNSSLKGVGITFSNGESVYAGAAGPLALNGEFPLGSVVLGFGANSGDLENIMSANTMTVSLPPFGATFQLSGSRKAICSVMQRCGANPPGCGGRRATPIVQPRCIGGQFYSKSARRCVCRKGQRFSKGRCRWVGKKCPRGFERVGGKCLRNEELDGPGSFCGPGYTMFRGKCIHNSKLKKPKPKPIRCNPGFERVGNKCLRNEELNGPGSFCGPGFTMVRGKCVHNSNLKPKKPKVKSGGCIGGQIRLANGNCVCPKGRVYINKQCISPKQIQKNLNQIFSDTRLKRDIKQVATTKDGINLYAFRYKGSDTTYVGVMAQDLLQNPHMRDAVHMTRYGFYAVDYGKLGLDLVTWKQWKSTNP